MRKNFTKVKERKNGAKIPRLLGTRKRWSHELCLSGIYVPSVNCGWMVYTSYDSTEGIGFFLNDKFTFKMLNYAMKKWERKKEKKIFEVITYLNKRK